MEIFIIALASLVASGLTLFSGFGLGTLLMPVVAIFFPIEIAIGITALVHFANNIFKLGLMGLHADKMVVMKFGLPAIVAAFLGAFLLDWLAGLHPLTEYILWGQVHQVMPVKFIIGTVIIIFVALELSPAFSKIALERKFLPIGGCISGFFGGLSGHQGAFRSMFLIKSGLSKEQFVATGIVLAVMVDMSRMIVYGWGATSSRASVDWLLVAIASFSAFSGAFIGSRLIKKLTLRSIQFSVSCLLVIVALGLMAGIL